MSLLRLSAILKRVSFSSSTYLRQWFFAREEVSAFGVDDDDELSCGGDERHDGLLAVADQTSIEALRVGRLPTPT